MARTLKARLPHPTAHGSAELRYHLLFSHNVAGAYRTTLHGDILDCNEAFAHMLGYRSRQELLARPATDLYFTRADRRSFLRRLRVRGKLTNSGLCLRRRDGTPLYILENVSLVPDHRGRPTIIQGTAIDISAQRKAEETLHRLTQHLQTVREEERTRIARELHDELGQALTALHLELHSLRTRVHDPIDPLAERLGALSKLVSGTLRAVRRICGDLRPVALDDLGLLPALEWHMQEFQRRTGVRCRLRRPAAKVTLPPEQATAVFRILQESLTNVARHARATQVAVQLKLTGGRLILTVADDGVGITPGQAEGAQTLGLVGIRERARSWNGDVAIAPRKGRGTLIRLTLPLVSPARRVTP